MSTDLVHIGQQPNNSLVTFGGFGGQALADAPISIENLELIQNTSRAEGGIPGQFRSKDTGSHVLELFCLPFYVQTKRVLFPDGNNFGAEPLCRSNDGLVPVAGVADRQSNDCATCHVGPKMWRAYAAAKRRGASSAELQSLKPKCDEKLEFVFLDKLTLGAKRLTVGGSSVSELKKAIKTIGNEVQQIQNMAKIDAARAKAQGKEYVPPTLGMYNFMIHLKGRKIAGQNGVFYVIDSRAGKTPFEAGVEEVTAEIYNDMAQKIMALRMRQVERQEADGEEKELNENLPQTPITTATMEEPVIEQY